MSYGTSLTEAYWQASDFVVRILKGEKTLDVREPVVVGHFGRGCPWPAQRLLGPGTGACLWILFPHSSARFLADVRSCRANCGRHLPLYPRDSPSTVCRAHLSADISCEGAIALRSEARPLTVLSAVLGGANPSYSPIPRPLLRRGIATSPADYRRASAKPRKLSDFHKLYRLRSRHRYEASQ